MDSIYDVQVEVPHNGRRRGRRRRLGGSSNNSVRPQPTAKVCCLANPNYAMTIRNDAVVLASANPTDEYQHWIKYMNWKVKDADGNLAFALVNKATRQAIKHSLGQSLSVRLELYNPKQMDESVLWTESGVVSNGGFRAIRTMNNISLYLHALPGGGEENGAEVVLSDSCADDSQRWKIQPYNP